MSNSKILLDIGTSGADWTTERKKKLVEAIKAIYGGHLPYSLSVDSVMKDVLNKYDLTRSEIAVRGKVCSILNRMGGVFDYDELVHIQDDKTIRIIKEFQPISESLYSSLNQKFKTQNSEHNLTKCVIGVSSLDERNLVYIYPTVLDADYGKIFSNVFRLDSSLVNGNFINDRNKSFCIDTSKTVCIPLQSEEFSKLSTCYQFLLDFLFSKLLGDLLASRRPKGSKHKDSKNKEILELLSTFKKRIGYCYSQKEYLESLLSSSNISFDNIDIKELIFIEENLEEDKIIIPEYWISTSSFFELYVYSIIVNDYPNATIDYKPKFNSLIPDIFIKADDEFDVDSVFDAKYKFQYHERQYCEVGDVNRMISYLFYLKDNTETYTSMNKEGVFYYPSIYKTNTISEETENEICSERKEFIRKEFVFLPLNKKLAKTLPG